jgi:NAD(P)-dependent dehydrogenase (short-subunit alcohol dehydrogenase family)
MAYQQRLMQVPWCFERVFFKALRSIMSNLSSPLRLKDRVALITGGGTGIGRAAARAYALNGCKVVVAGRRKEEIDATVHLITSEGGEAFAVSSDVSVAESVRGLVAATVARYGRLDIAFNNAGSEGRFAPITELTEADFDSVVGVNLKGVWLLVKYEIEAMLSHGQGGAIVNTSSFLAEGATVGSSVYSASKGALIAMIRVVALEYGPRNIRINNILPGAINTPMFRRLAGPDALVALTAFTPLRRIGSPDEVGDVAVWLSTDEARFVTGQSILVDGGFTIPGMR